MTDEIEQSVQRLAYIAALKKRLKDLEEQERAILLKPTKRRTEYAVDDTGEEMATVVVKYVDADPKPGVSIDDESLVLPWLEDAYQEEFHSLISTGLTAAGRNEVIAYARRRYLEDGEANLPGLRVTAPADRQLTVSVTPKKNIVDLVEGMVQRDAVSFTELLSIEGGKA